MNKKNIFIIFSLILLLFSINIPAVAEPVIEEHDDFIVTWFEISQYPFVYDISIQNLLPEKRDINITSIFDSTSFSINDLEVVGFYEWKNVSYTVIIPEYGEVTWWNGTEWITNIQVINEYEETRYKLAWKPCKTQSFKQTATQYRENMGIINIPKFGSKPKDGTDNGTKWFRIEFNAPMNSYGSGWGSAGRIALDLSGAEFDPWWDGDWLYRRQIDIDNSASTETFDNFTVRIALTSSNIDWTHVQDDLDDLRFTDSDEVTLLDAELENHAVNDWAEIWVRIPSLTSAGTYSIFIYYGNVGASSAWDEEDTWDPQWEGVWHFDETSGDHDDSTAGDEDLSPIGSPDQAKTLVIDGASGLDGSDDVYEIADDNDLDCTGDWTVFWLGNVTDETGEAILFGKKKNEDNYPLWQLSHADGTGLVKWYVRHNTYTIMTGTTDIFDKFTFVSAVRDNADTDDLYIYVNGTSDQTPAEDLSGQADISNAGKFSVGAIYFDAPASGFAQGTVDEVRIFRGALSAEWMEAENKNLFNTWSTYQAEEVGVYTTSVTHTVTVQTTEYTTSSATSCDSYYSTFYTTMTVSTLYGTTTVYSTTSYGTTVISVDETISVDQTISGSVNRTEIVASTITTTVTQYTTVETTQQTTVTGTSCDSYYSTAYGTSAVTSVSSTATGSFTTTVGTTIESVVITISVDETVTESVDETIIVASTDTSHVTLSTTVLTTDLVSGSSTLSELLAYATTYTSTYDESTLYATSIISITFTSATTPHLEIVTLTYSIDQTLTGGANVIFGIAGATAGSAIGAIIFLIMIAIPVILAMTIRVKRR